VQNVTKVPNCYSPDALLERRMHQNSFVYVAVRRTSAEQVEVVEFELKVLKHVGRQAVAEAGRRARR